MSIQFNGNQEKTQVLEKDQTFQDEFGFRVQIQEITLNHIDLRWGSYSAPVKKNMTLHPGKAAVISHFQLSGDQLYDQAPNKLLPGKKFITYREPLEPYDVCIEPSPNREISYFKLMFTEQFFHHLVTEESDFLINFQQTAAPGALNFDFTAPFTPRMFSIINEMQNAPYEGYLKSVYLESKATELFLMQVMLLDQKKSGRQIKQKQRDIESLYAIRDYLSSNFQQRCSISDLAKQAGINQMKLKNGFKELFGTTIFAYLTDIRMQEARRLLLDEKMYVAEVSDIMGYRHPHHFTAAFKKKFGLVPTDLKS